MNGSRSLETIDDGKWSIAASAEGTCKYTIVRQGCQRICAVSFPLCVLHSLPLLAFR